MKTLLLLQNGYNYYNQNTNSSWFGRLWEGMLNGDLFSILKMILLISIVIYILFYKVKKEYLSRWNCMLDDFSFSSKEFYDELKKELQETKINGIETNYELFPEGHIGSSKRLYMRVEWKNFQYDVCAAPFGKGFFVSWWLFGTAPVGKQILSKIPLIGIWLSNKLFRITYYKIDTGIMFQTYCHQCVQNVIDRITSNKGVRLPNQEERKPIFIDFLKR